MKKKVMSFVVMMTICMSMLSGLTVYGAKSFSDVSESAWYYNNVSTLTGLEILSGYPDGTFRPSNKIKVGEFIKTVIVASRIYDVSYISGEHWATAYVNKAIELGYVEEGEFTDFDAEITRGEMCNIIARALPIVGDESYVDESEWERYEMAISDFDSIDEAQQDHVLMVYSKGVLGGYPDGEFKAENSLKRSEACAVLNRMIDEEARLEVETISESEWEAYQDGVQVVEGVTFTPGVDTFDSGNIKRDVVEELWEVAFEELLFWRDEETGTLMCSGYVPYAPEGYETQLTIKIFYNDLVDNGYYGTYSYTVSTHTAQLPPNSYVITEGESFEYEILDDLDNIDVFNVSFKIVKDGDGSAPTYIALRYLARDYHISYVTDDYINKSEDLEIEWEEKFLWLNEE